MTNKSQDWWADEFRAWWVVNWEDLVRDFDPNDIEEFSKQLAKQSWQAALDICG